MLIFRGVHAIQNHTNNSCALEDDPVLLGGFWPIFRGEMLGFREEIERWQFQKLESVWGACKSTPGEKPPCLFGGWMMYSYFITLVKLQLQMQLHCVISWHFMSFLVWVSTKSSWWTQLEKVWDSPSLIGFLRYAPFSEASYVDEVILDREKALVFWGNLRELSWPLPKLWIGTGMSRKDLNI